MRRSTIGAFDFESHLTDIGASTPRWKAALARSKPNSCTTLAIQPGKLPGMTCSLTSKDITIVSGYIPPSGISLPNRQSAKPLDPVSTKSGEGHPVSHLEHFKGVLHVDGYAGFERLTGKGDIVLAACWAHTRRKFYEVAEATGSPVAAEALRRIGELYVIEAEVRGQSPPYRLAARHQRSKPIVDALHTWLERQLPRISGRSTLAEAMRYALVRWDGLTRFLHDGRIELDTNPVERAIRPVTLGRKNHLFAGSDGGGARWAIVCSLIETCKLNGVEPYAYLHDVLQRMVDGQPVNRLDELLPWAWKEQNVIKQ
jgi:hypothetical protein